VDPWTGLRPATSPLQGPDASVHGQVVQVRADDPVVGGQADTQQRGRVPGLGPDRAAGGAGCGSSGRGEAQDGRGG
jgi:hypothetical protein